MRAMILGLLMLGACGGELPIDAPDPQVAAVDEIAGATPTIDPEPRVNWCVRGAFEFGEWACPGHPGCAMCRLQIPGGQDGIGIPPIGCIAPSGAACVDFCEYCPADPGDPS